MFIATLKYLHLNRKLSQTPGARSRGPSKRLKDYTSPPAGGFEELPRSEGAAWLNAYQKERNQKALPFLGDKNVLTPVRHSHLRLLVIKGWIATVWCFWLLVGWLPKSTVYEQNGLVSWRYSVSLWGNELFWSCTWERSSSCWRTQNQCLSTVGISQEHNFKRPSRSQNKVGMNEKQNCGARERWMGVGGRSEVGNGSVLIVYTWKTVRGKYLRKEI